MKSVFIKYNPYKLETEITVDRKHLKQNSILAERASDGSRLQEWVEELPRILINEYADNDFEIAFHGTVLDYEDLTSVFTEAYNRGELTAKLNHIPAKETIDKEALIDEVFTEIQKGPFDELRDTAIIAAFQNAKCSDFEVCVVATMSAGKSTLINAMLGKKLMPSKNEACTAIITRIKDTTQEDVPFKAEVYGKDCNLSESHENLTYPIMERLNADENVSVIKVSGNIPFVHSDDVSLVLIDTPGPTNARNPEHKKVFYEMLNNSSKPLLLFVMDPQYESEDTYNLLNKISKSMEVGGKQSKDRFLFVVNKLDVLDVRADTPETFLDRVRSYIQNVKITNPNLYPVASLPALNIRLMAGGVDIDEDTRDDIEVKIRKLNRNKALHFETYASLPPSINGEISTQLYESKQIWDGGDNENPDEALIHTGLVSVEAAIRQYVQKYAKTSKIRNIVDTFMYKLNEQREMEGKKQSIAEKAKSDDDNAKKELAFVLEQIESIRKKMDDAHGAKKFKDAVDDAVVRVNDDSKEVVEGIIQKFQARIRKRIDKLRDAELSIDDAEDEVERLGNFAKKLEPDFEVELDELIRTDLMNTSHVLLDGYKQKLASLTEELDVDAIAGVKIDPLKLMTGSVTSEGFSTQNLVKSKEVEDGTERVQGEDEWVVNTDRKWFKPWTWFQEKGYWRETYYERTKYKTIKYIYGSELAQDFFKPIQQGLYDNGEGACKYALKQSKRIAGRFNEEFKRLDEILKGKLSELESYATDQKRAEERIKESERKLEWLEQIKAKVESILEI